MISLNKKYALGLLLFFLLQNTTFYSQRQLTQLDPIDISLNPIGVKTASIQNSTINICDFEFPITSTSIYQPSNPDIIFSSGSGYSNNNSGFTFGNPIAPQGNQVLFLQSSGSIIIRPTITQEGLYRIKYKAAIRGNIPNQQQGIQTYIDNELVSDKKITNTSYTDINSVTIYLSTGTHEVKLNGTSQNDDTAFVDDLKFEKIWDWNDSATWGGSRPPSNNDAVEIKNNVVVAISNLQNNPVSVKSINIFGQLIVPQNKNLNLTTKRILIKGPNSLFEVGQDKVPYLNNLIITLTESQFENNNSNQKYLMATDYGKLDLHGMPKTSWTKLKKVISSNVIELDEANNWKVNDKIVITSNNNDWDNYKEAKITNITGNQITLDISSVISEYEGVKDKVYTNGNKNWIADLRPEVGMLSHNITIQGDVASENTGFGGNIMIMDKSKAFVENVELFRMGQKSKKARYPFHWHRLGNDGKNQYFLNSSVHKSYNRAITIHATNGTLVSNNFFFHHIGHGVFFEDGNEIGNWVSKNLVLKTIRPRLGEEVIPSDNGGLAFSFTSNFPTDMAQNRTPASFWITNPWNVIEDNIAAGTEGTGYWYAFPTLVTDIYGNTSKPYELGLLSFKRNTAHSCMNGIDLFDHIGPDEEIISNGSWSYPGLVSFEDNLWYANHTGVYTGIGENSYNFMFNNNIFVENYVNVMLANNTLINNSVFVADKSLKLMQIEKYINKQEIPYVSMSEPIHGRPDGLNFRTSLYRVYDGAGRIERSHFIGWSDPETSLLWNVGAAVKHTNHQFNLNTTDAVINNGNHPINIYLDNYDILPTPTSISPSDPVQPQMWNVVIKDIDGSLSGKAGSSIISNHPFLHFADKDITFDNWTNTYRSDYSFVTAMVTYSGHEPGGGPNNDMPQLVVTRTKANTETVSIHDMVHPTAYRANQVIPVIVNDAFLYTYNYSSLSQNKDITLTIDDATAGDVFVSRFKGFGKLGGLQLSNALPKNSIQDVLNSTVSCYFKDSYGGDLYIKIVAQGKRQSFLISWISDSLWAEKPFHDTDGDEMLDIIEIVAGRHPFDAGDLAANFETPNLYEGWNTIFNIAHPAVVNGSLIGLSSGNGDAMIANNSYNFTPKQVNKIAVKMHIFSPTPIIVELFFKTNIFDFYNANMKAQAIYSGNGDWRTLVFDFSQNPNWNGASTITGLRLDPVQTPNILFAISEIKAVYEDDGIPHTATSLRSVVELTNPEEKDLSLDSNINEEFKFYPNPVTKNLTISNNSIIDSVEIISFLGQKVLALNINSFSSDIDLSSLSKGIYFVKVFSNNQSRMFKILKD